MKKGWLKQIKLYQLRIFNRQVGKVIAVSPKNCVALPSGIALESISGYSLISEDYEYVLVLAERVWCGWGERYRHNERGKDLWISYILTHQAWTNTVVTDRQSHSGMPLIPRKFNQVTAWLDVCEVQHVFPPWGRKKGNFAGGWSWYVTLIYREWTCRKWFLVAKCILDV